MGTITSTVVVCLAALTHQPNDTVVVKEKVDLIEVNHFYDEKGRLVFDQLIFYDWCPERSRYNVRAWRLLKKPIQVPYRNAATGQYLTVWHDGDVLRKIHAESVRESWTQYDPELVEREFLPKEKRRELAKPIVRK